MFYAHFQLIHEVIHGPHQRINALMPLELIFLMIHAILQSGFSPQSNSKNNEGCVILVVCRLDWAKL